MKSNCMYLILADTYLTVLRPKILQYYGYSLRHPKIFHDSMILLQINKSLSTSGLQGKMIQHLKLFDMIDQNRQREKNNYPQPPLKITRTSHLYHQITAILQTKAQLVYQNSQPLGKQSIFEPIDIFRNQEDTIGVTNNSNIDNYLSQLKQYLRVNKQEQQYCQRYNENKHAFEVFNNIYEKMVSDDKKQMYLIIKSAQQKMFDKYIMK